MANASNATPAVIAARIVDAVGGPANITSLTHCATRLHFELADAGHVNQHGLESIPGVLGAFPRAGNRYQVIIGGAVASVYEQIVRLRTARLMPAAQLPSAVMQSASQSTQPTQSMQPTQPAQPAQSAQSTQPTQPAQSAPYLSDDAAPSRDTATDAEQVAAHPIHPVTSRLVPSASGAVPPALGLPRFSTTCLTRSARFWACYSVPRWSSPSST